MPSIIISSISALSGKSALASAVIARLRDEGISVVSVVDTGDLFVSDDGVKSVLSDQIEFSASEVAVIEGSRGDARSDLALAEKLDANVLIVAGLGEDVRSAADSYGERFAGAVLNKVPRYRDIHANNEINALSTDGIKCLGWLPEDRRLEANTVEHMMDQLEGELVFKVNTTDELVENVLIGGFVLDWGPFYFASQENTCVVVRAGRPDVQIAALQSDTTRALVLTGGEKPIDYVFYEARTRQIPLIMVNGDTNATIDALDEIDPSSFAHPDKLARMSQIMLERSIVDPILDLLAQPATR